MDETESYQDGTGTEGLPAEEENTSTDVGAPENEPEDEGTPPSASAEIPDHIKGFISKEKKRHRRQLRERDLQLQQRDARFEQLQNELDALKRGRMTDNPMDSFSQPSPLGNEGADSGIEHHINRAVSVALQQKEMQERNAQQQAQQQKVQDAYKNLHAHLEKASDKHDDFEDVVYSPDTPYTQPMVDASLLLSNPGDVLYHIGKDKELVKRLGSLHPIELAKEMIQLSKTLEGVGTPTKKTSNAQIIGQVKTAPVSPANRDGKMSISERRRLKRQEW